MSFQIKDFRSIVASMINVASATQNKVTDFSVGSVARTLMEAPAIEMEEMYLQMVLGLKEAIPVAVFDSFNFAQLGAIGSSGVVRFSAAGVVATAVLVPAGTQVTTAAGTYKYVTLTDASIAIGQTYVDVLVYCTIGESLGEYARRPEEVLLLEGRRPV